MYYLIKEKRKKEEKEEKQDINFEEISNINTEIIQEKEIKEGKQAIEEQIRSIILLLNIIFRSFVFINLNILTENMCDISFGQNPPQNWYISGYMIYPDFSHTHFLVSQSLTDL